MSSVVLKNLVKSYDGKKNIIDNINLEIEDKEFIVLVGSSGCGKSTILRLISGLEEVTSGEILIDDKVVNNTHPKDRDIAFVFQSYALYPHMSVYENIAFGLKMRKYPKNEIDVKVREVAKALNLDFIYIFNSLLFTLIFSFILSLEFSKFFTSLIQTCYYFIIKSLDNQGFYVHIFKISNFIQFFLLIFYLLIYENVND